MAEQKYSIEHLVNLIGLTQLVTGEKLKELTLTPDFYTWYVQSAQQMAEAYHLTPGFVDGKVIFNGVELKKRLKLEGVNA